MQNEVPAFAGSDSYRMTCIFFIGEILNSSGSFAQIKHL